jgi:hypothetical protein
MSKSRELLGQRYGRAEDWAASAELNPVLETIFSHRSVSSLVFAGALCRSPQEAGAEQVRLVHRAVGEPIVEWRTRR